MFILTFLHYVVQFHFALDSSTAHNYSIHLPYSGPFMCFQVSVFVEYMCMFVMFIVIQSILLELKILLMTDSAHKRRLMNK